ncbi:MAG: TonB-dependent receptor [Bacteroidota bacterium]
MKSSILLFSLLLFPFALLLAQKATISGTVEDASSGETIIGATLIVQTEPIVGTTTNAYGKYSITLPIDTYRVSISYVGYATQDTLLDLSNGDIRLDVSLSSGVALEEVVVTGSREDRNVARAEMGIVQLPLNKIKELPALLGEPDPLKLAQYSPGITSASDGSSGIYVRGGGADQNLVLLDEAVVYNSGHILGFFSVFNPDALKNTTIYKGAMPANYGGRLSSVIDIQMKDGNNKDFSVEGGIGIVSSRLTVEGPIVENRTSFIVSARRTYAYDLARPFLEGSDFDGTNYFFYDLNTKINHRFSEKDRLYLSGYFGRDLLNFASRFRDANFGINYGNLTGTARWNREINSNLFMNTSIIYNEYDYAFIGREFGLDANITSGVADWNGKIDFDYRFTPKKRPHEMKFGVNFIRHKLTPNVTDVSAVGSETNLFGQSGVRFGNEYAIYILDEFDIDKKGLINLNIGIRATAYQFFGPYTSLVTGAEFKENQIVTTYYGIEPRILARYTLTDESSFKAGIAYTNQYVHMVTNTASSLPLDIWVPSTDLVQPQRGWQASLGYFRNLDDNNYEISIEGYFREFNNQIDYGENYVNDPTDDLEEQFVFGDGLAYGMEFYLRKRKGDLTGWLSYTASRTERLFPDINDGRPYPAFQDRPHDFSALLSYEINPKWQLGAIFVYTSGTPITPIQSAFITEQSPNFLFGRRNSARIRPYHRLDISATLSPKPESDKRFSSSWTFAIYNLYDNRNPLFFYYDTEQDAQTGDVEVVGKQVSFFPVIPSVTWNFKWQQKPAK